MDIHGYPRKNDMDMDMDMDMDGIFLIHGKPDVYARIVTGQCVQMDLKQNLYPFHNLCSLES